MASIMKTLITMIMVMILLMMKNTEKMGVLEHYLKNLIEILANQQETMVVLPEEIIVT